MVAVVVYRVCPSGSNIQFFLCSLGDWHKDSTIWLRETLLLPNIISSRYVIFLPESMQPPRGLLLCTVSFGDEACAIIHPQEKQRVFSCFLWDSCRGSMSISLPAQFESQNAFICHLQQQVSRNAANWPFLHCLSWHITTQVSFFSMCAARVPKGVYTLFRGFSLLRINFFTPESIMTVSTGYTSPLDHGSETFETFYILILWCITQTIPKQFFCINPPFRHCQPLSIGFAVPILPWGWRNSLLQEVRQSSHSG